MRKRDGMAEENKMKMEGYQALANAVVLQAVADYRRAKAVLKRFPDNQDAEKRKKDAEGFLRGKWFRMLTDVNPEYLMRKLKEEEK